MDNFKLKKYRKIADQVVNLSAKYVQMSDSQLKEQTAVFRQRLADGQTLDDILVEAFAVVREADQRILHQKPYPVQIMGGAILHSGKIAEMKTGEGKTLTATMPMYLNGLLGPGNFLITANSYLAIRDKEEIGKVYEWLGLTVSAGTVADNEDSHDMDKDAVYSADIVYTTNSALGFDYLFDNLAAAADEQFIQGFNFALIDEIDAVLLDMAQTPLIVSGAPKVQSNLYEISDKMIRLLQLDEDIELSDDLKKAWFTEAGIQHIEKLFGIEGLLSPEWKHVYRAMTLALNAHYLYIKDRDYVVENGEVILLDFANGRKQVGSKLGSGFHQAIEVKEHLDPTRQTRAMASITYQNLFRMFKKLAGMTGTAKTDVEEFRETYNLDVIVVPTNKAIKRQDHPDKTFFTNEGKIYASLELVKQNYQQHRPILIETGSVSMSELYSRLLLKEGIPHSLLNAGSVAKEAKIVAEAGNENAVTVATSMAGRGTDIKISEAVKANGGLLVVGTERMTSKRIDNQLRGRAGRQGANGESVFFTSLDDDIVVRNGPKWVDKIRAKVLAKIEQGQLSDSEPLKGRKYNRIIENAQSGAKQNEKNARLNTLQYDEILRIQRQKIYDTRNEIINGYELAAKVQKILTSSVQDFVDHDLKAASDVSTFIYNTVDYGFTYESTTTDVSSKKSKKIILRTLFDIVGRRFEQRKALFNDDSQFVYFQRLAVLKAIDTVWIEQVDNLEQLKSVVSGRDLGQHIPIYEYQGEAKKSFDKMKSALWQQATKNLLLSEVKYKPDGSMDVVFP